MEDSVPVSCLHGDKSLPAAADAADGFSISRNIESTVENTNASEEEEDRDGQVFRVVGAVQVYPTKTTPDAVGDGMASVDKGQGNLAVLEKGDQMNSELLNMRSGEAGGKSNRKGEMGSMHNQQLPKTSDMGNSADHSRNDQTLIKTKVLLLEDATLNMLSNLSLLSQDKEKGLQWTDQEQPGSNGTSDQASCTMQVQQFRMQAHGSVRCNLPHFSIHHSARDLGLKECCVVVTDFQVSGQTKLDSCSASRKSAAHAYADRAKTSKRLNPASNLEPEVDVPWLRSTARRRADSSDVFQKESKKECCMSVKDFKVSEQLKGLRRTRRNNVEHTTDYFPTSNSPGHLKIEPGTVKKKSTFISDDIQPPTDSTSVCQKRMKKEACPSPLYPNARPRAYTKDLLLKECHVSIKDIKPYYTKNKTRFRKGYKFPALFKDSWPLTNGHKTEKCYSEVRLIKKCSVLLRNIISSEPARKSRPAKPRYSMMADAQALDCRSAAAAEGQTFEKHHEGLQIKAATEVGQARDDMKNIGLRECSVILDRKSGTGAWIEGIGHRRRPSRVYQGKAHLKQLWKVDKSWPALKGCFVALERMKMEV